MSAIFAAPCKPARRRPTYAHSPRPNSTERRGAILERQKRGGGGAGIVDKVSADLRAAVPSMKGFSRSNLKYMRAFAEAWSEGDFVQQPVGQLPWGHNLVLLTKLKARDARLAYAARALEHGWSRAVLVHHLEARTVERQGKETQEIANDNGHCV